MFRWLAAYGVATVFSALNSVNPTVSLIDCKQLVLFLIVPLVYRFARGSWALTFATVIITVGALGALIGIAQFGLLHFDNLSRRPHGSLTHYMTYSGVLMLVACAAAARLVFRREGTHFFGGSRTWTVLVMPALIVALALTSRAAPGSGWSPAWAPSSCSGPAAARRHPAGGRAHHPGRADQRHRPDISMFDVNDPSNSDRVAMLQSGVEIVARPPAHRRRTGHGRSRSTSEYRQP